MPRYQGVPPDSWLLRSFSPTPCSLLSVSLFVWDSISLSNPGWHEHERPCPRLLVLALQACSTTLCFFISDGLVLSTCTLKFISPLLHLWIQQLWHCLSDPLLLTGQSPSYSLPSILSQLQGLLALTLSPSCLACLSQAYISASFWQLLLMSFPSVPCCFCIPSPEDWLPSPGIWHIGGALKNEA